MNNSDYVPTDAQLMMVDITHLLLGILQLMLNICVVVTMWQPSQIVMPLCHICIFHAAIFILIGLFRIHDAFSSLSSHQQSGYLCHFRVISIVFFKVMAQWNVLLMLSCSILMVLPGRPFMYVFVSTKYFLILTLVNELFSGITVFLIFFFGTTQIARHNCEIIVVYSAEARGYIQGMAFLMMIFLCSVRLWRHFRGSCPVSPDCIDYELQDKHFSAASYTLLIYSIFFLVFAIPRNMANMNKILSNHVTAFWYHFEETSEITWTLSGVVLFPICFVRHHEIQKNFYSMICFKCMMFNNVFHEEVDDRYRRVTLLREVVLDPVRRDKLRASLQLAGNKRMSNAYMSNSIARAATRTSLSAPGHRPTLDNSAEKETVGEDNDVIQRSARVVSFDT